MKSDDVIIGGFLVLFVAGSGRFGLDTLFRRKQTCTARFHQDPLSPGRRQSTRAPVALMTFVHLTFSLRMNWLNSAGVVP